MAAASQTSKREFTVEKAYTYNRSGPIRWIVSHIMRYWYLPVAMVAMAVVNNTAFSGIRVYVGQGFDILTADQTDMDAFTTVALTIAGMAVLQATTGLIRNYTFDLAAQLVERNAREELYVSLLGKSQDFHGRQQIGDIMARATNDVRQLNFMFSPGVRLIADAALGTVIPVIMMGSIHRDLLLVPLIFVVLLAITIYDYNRRLSPISNAQREQFGEMNSGLAEAVNGIEVVKANVREKFEWQKFTSDARAFRDYYVEQGIIEARYLPMLMFTICWAGAFLHALYLWQAGTITIGQVVSFTGLMGTLRFPTFISIFAFNMVQLGISGARRILKLLNAESALDENEGGITKEMIGEVTFQNVSFGYEEGKTVLKNVTFTAHPGETVAIVGQTGSGKSTLTSLINRIFDVNEGRVLVDGIDVREWSLESLRSQISTIEQDVFLFSITVAANIAFGVPDAPREEIVAAAKEAQAHDFIMEDLGDGYDTEIEERGANLSGGQRQRLAIARAFLTDPRILILDDSTSAIDSATEDKIQRAMRRISEQRTTFIITHRLSQIRWADRILVLRGGELVDQGKHEELLERSDAYRRIFARYDK